MKNGMTSSGRITANTYDLVGNVTQVSSICPWLQNQSFTENYSYDSTDQLISANEAQSYQLAVNYGNWGKIMQYDIAQTDMLSSATETHSRNYSYPAANYSNAQTSFAPIMQTGDEQINLSYGINGSLRKKEVTQPQQNTEYYLFNSQANLKAYSDDVMSFAYYGYNAANTRTYKLSLYNTNLWINGQQQPLNLQLQNAMFYPNTYLNFNGNGEYTKHYYNGTERIASRLGDNTTTIALNNNILEDRKLQLEEQFRVDIHKLIEETVPIDLPPFIDVNTLQPTGTPNDIYYYHPNHLGSTSFVTDNNATITQGFLYAPFGEITTEYNINFGNNVIPKYSFNAKELDEENGMYYYEARYYKPPVFTSRDPLFEKYFWMTPYAYCANNPVKYVDPDGRKIIIKDGNKSYYYVNGHVYLNKKGRGLIFDSALGKEASKIKNNLDIMRNDNAGAKVVGRLTKSKETYTIAADAKGGCGSYRASINKVSLVSGDLNNMEALSHELFHAYQDDNGRIPHTVYNEVEAYIFSGMMIDESTMGMMSDKNPEYSKHANNMKKEFSNKSFNYLLSHFRRDSKANNPNGTYNRYEYNPGKYTSSQSLLRNLYN